MDKRGENGENREKGENGENGVNGEKFVKLVKPKYYNSMRLLFARAFNLIDGLLVYYMEATLRCC